MNKVAILFLILQLFVKKIIFIILENQVNVTVLFADSLFA